MVKADEIMLRRILMDTKSHGLCPAVCEDKRLGPHWHDYLFALREAKYLIRRPTEGDDGDETET